MRQLYEEAYADWPEIYALLGPDNRIQRLPSYQKLIVSPEEEQWKTLLFAISSISDFQDHHRDKALVKMVVARNLLQTLPFQTCTQFQLTAEVIRYFNPDYLEVLLDHYLTRLEQAEFQPDEALKKSLSTLWHFVHKKFTVATMKPLRKRFEVLWTEPQDNSTLAENKFGPSSLLNDLNNWLSALPATDQTAFVQFFEQCLEQQQKTSPSVKWLVAAEKSLNEVAPDVQAILFVQLFQTTIAFIAEKHRQPTEDFGWERTAGVPNWISPVCWYAGRYCSDHAPLRQAMSDLTDIGYKKMPIIGSLAVKTSNACLQGFAQMPDNKGVVAILRQQKRATNRNIKNTIDKLLDSLAGKNGITQGELREMSIPDFNLDETGMVAHDFGDHEAILIVSPSTKPQIQWLQKSTGKALKTAPAAAKRDQASAYKTLQNQFKELKGAVSSSAHALESAWLERRIWTLESLSSRLLQHPVLKVVASRLIWQFEHDGQTGEAMFYEGAWQNPDEKSLAWLTPDTTVQLWHPISNKAQQVLEWRNWLEARQITQPFKQAFREVYLVTPPEINTHSYSNRFAAHVLRQHQFAALCSLRGWHYKLQGGFYSENSTSYRDVQAWQYRIEFWTETGGFDELTDSGIFPYIGTDQVRFSYQGRPVNIPDVPPLLFSELMRDVDLFVGVCSIGNDPNWQDSGNDRLRQYWHTYAFADDLSASGEVRLEALKRIVPKLKIGSKCRFEGKYLLVQGSKHLYKIHCGSGNILMSPNDQYLCIVPDQSAKPTRQDVYLPFEGDTLLSIIISKAMLLAADHAITDPTILRQI